MEVTRMLFVDTFVGTREDGSMCSALITFLFELLQTQILLTTNLSDEFSSTPALTLSLSPMQRSKV